MRDEILSKKEKGRKYIQLFYHLGPEISKILALNPELKSRSLSMVKKLLPHGVSLLEGQSMVLDADTVKEAEDLMNDFFEQAGSQLQKAIIEIREDLLSI